METQFKSVMTVQVAGTVVSLVPIALSFDASDPSLACKSTVKIIKYIPFGDRFYDTSVIWDDEAGTQVPTSGFYSDENYSRQWNGSILTAPTSCPIIGARVHLAFHASSAQEACYTYPATTNFFIPTLPFETTAELYTDLEMTTFAPPGHYSDGVKSRNWKSTLFGPTSICSLAVQVSLGFSPSSTDKGATPVQPDACTEPKNPFYMPYGKVFSNTNKLSSDTAQIIPAPLGVYSDGSVYREWNGTIFSGIGGSCSF